MRCGSFLRARIYNIDTTYLQRPIPNTEECVARRGRSASAGKVASPMQAPVRFCSLASSAAPAAPPTGPKKIMGWGGVGCTDSTYGRGASTQEDSTGNWTSAGTHCQGSCMRAMGFPYLLRSTKGTLDALRVVAGRGNKGGPCPSWGVVFQVFSIQPAERPGPDPSYTTLVSGQRQPWETD
jgi:hypothetical protein